MILVMAFMIINPFNFPIWVIIVAWMGLVADVIFELYELTKKTEDFEYNARQRFR
jgi:hypothetical protein